MKKLIDKTTIKEWLEKRKIPFKKDINDGVYPTYLCALMDFDDFINTLEVKDVDLKEQERQLIDNLREVLSAHMHGGEIDEVLAELDEKMKGE